jgi:hypothetical protein
MSTALAQGSRESQAVCLNYVMRHPVAFREYWAPRVTKRKFWHRYNFSPVMLAADAGDTAFYAGRGSGKSFSVLEPEPVRHAVTHPGEETLVTSLRKVHVTARMERVIDYFEGIDFFKLFLKRVVRSPVYQVETKTGHIIYGVSFGDDPEARTVQGPHASLIITEESQQVPPRPWIKLQGSKDPRGSRTLMIGVPDGRLDTPFRHADTKFESFAGRRFHLSRRHDPYWDTRAKKSAVDQYNGDDSDMFKQEIDAEWGHPVWSAWDIDALGRCVEGSLVPVYLKIGGKAYRQAAMTPTVVCADLPGPDRIHRHARRMLALDVGYSQATEILVMEERQERWWLIARIELVDRMEHNDQAAVIKEIANRYLVERVGLDTSEGEGRAIAAELEEDDYWRLRVVRVDFRELRVSGYTPEGEEVHEPSRDIGTKQIRTMINIRDLAIPRDEQIMEEFNSEVEMRLGDGTTKIKTPATVHITDAFRVFGVLAFLEHPPLPPGAAKATIVMPEWGGTGPWGRPAAYVM